jgi:bla regulator protein blaR1
MALAVSAALGQVNTLQSTEQQPTAASRMEFDVASVRLTKPDTLLPNPDFPVGTGDSRTNGVFRASFPLMTYIAMAYSLSLTPEQKQAILSQMPAWAATEFFTIDARAAGNPTKDQMILMMRSLLADRFKLAVHFETRDVSVFALKLTKTGKTRPRLRAHADGPPCHDPEQPSVSDWTEGPSDVYPPLCGVFGTKRTTGQMIIEAARNITMDELANALAPVGRLGRPMVDRTGLTGKFDFKLEWVWNSPTTPDGDEQLDTDGPTFEEALREQLGLKLIPMKAPLQVLIVDHVETLSEN